MMVRGRYSTTIKLTNVLGRGTNVPDISGISLAELTMPENHAKPNLQSPPQSSAKQNYVAHTLLIGDTPQNKETGTEERHLPLPRDNLRRFAATHLWRPAHSFADCTDPFPRRGWN